MAVTHILGFPRIGAKRELKTALESFWRGELPEAQLSAVGRELRARHWQRQRDSGLDFVTVGDFAWYDQMLGTLALLGATPARFAQSTAKEMNSGPSRPSAIWIARPGDAANAARRAWSATTRCRR